MNDQRQVADCPHGELAVGWALRSLEPAEESLVAAHLPDCLACRCLASRTEEVGAMLGLSVPELIPSDGLEQRILSVTGTQWNSSVVPLVPPTSPVRSASVPSWFAPVKVLAAAAAVMVAAGVALGVWVVQLDGQLNQAQRQVSAMSEALQSAADPAAVRVPLATEDGRRVGMVLASGGQVAVLPTRLPSNRVADQTYVLWGLAGQTPIALAAFDVSGEKFELHAVSSATSVGSFTGYAISLEPGRHAPVVPTEVVASGRVTS
ncbi:MAG: anti-sigma factor domain-containing protein [Pseudonocardiaceae bacterium]